MKLSRNAVKAIAMITMVFDHVGLMFFSGNLVLYILFRYVIGRIAYPLFGALFIEGIFRSKHPKKNALLLAGFACLAEPFFDKMLTGTFFDLGYQNVLWLYLLISLFALWDVYSEKKFPSGRMFCVKSLLDAVFWVAIFGITVYGNVDYGLMGSGAMFICYYLYKRNIASSVVMTLVFASIEMLGSFMPCCFLAVLVMLCYDSEKPCGYSRYQKYVSYGFYPVHLAVLCLISVILGLSF